MNTLTYIFFGLEALFVLMVIPISIAFLHVQKKQEEFFRALQHAPGLRLRHSILFATYLAMTLVLCSGTAIYYTSHFL